MTASPRLATIALIVLCSTRPGLADPAATDAPGGEPPPLQVLPCRPTISGTAEIVPAGVLEVELGYAQRRAADAAVHSAVALLKYSLTDRLQLQLGTNNLVTVQTGASTQAVDGAYLGPKLVLHAQTAQLPAVSISVLVMIPTRSGAGAITTTTDADLWIYLSKDLLGFHTDFNVGVNFLSFMDHPETQAVVALAVSHDLTHGLGAMLEGYTFEGGGSRADHDAGVLMALSYSVTPKVMFDAGVDYALYRDARDLTVFGGVTFIPYQTSAPAPRTAVAALAR